MLVLLLIPALNPPRVDEAVMPSTATAARLAKRAPLCLLMRRIIAFPVVVGLVTTFLRSPIDTAPVFATGVCPVNSLKKTFDLTKDAIDLDHPGLTFGPPQGSPAGICTTDGSCGAKDAEDRAVVAPEGCPVMPSVRR